MGMSTLTRIVGVIVMAVAGLVLMGGPALAQPGYGEGGPTASLSASVSSTDITVVATGFVPGEPVTATVFSDPWVLGTKNADASGTVVFTFSVRDLEPGQHRIVLSAASGSVTATFFVVRSGHGDHDGSGSSSGHDSNSSSDHDSDSSSDHDSDSSSGHDSDSSSSDDDSDSSSSDSSDSSSSGDSSSSSDSSDSTSSSDSSTSDGLAFTGSNAILPLSVVGGLLLIGGGVAVASSRRKRAKTRV